MIQSIYAGISGLQSFQTGIDVLANNIANVNTVGFKGSRTEFSNLYSKALADGNPASPLEVGVGTRVSATTLDLQTGSYYQTDSITDLSIQGEDGWFGLFSGGDQFYTRAGNFGFDAFIPAGETVNASISNLVNQDGLYVSGIAGQNFTYNPSYVYSDNEAGAYVLDSEIDTLTLSDATLQESLDFPTRFAYPPVATNNVSFFGNLGAVNETRSISSEVISATGDRNSLRLVFTQTTPQPATGSSWDITAQTTSNNYNANSGAGTLFDTQTGIATFNGSGAMIGFTLPPLNNDGTSVNVELGTGYAGLVAIDGPSIAFSSENDGNISGELTGYGFQNNGDVVASFSNGKDTLIGKVAIYHFQNDKGLESLGSNIFQTSQNSGQAIFYAQENGEMYSHRLENSNVSLETALTELIIMQRSYDATAKTISTSDQMLQNALNMGA